jgi:hypothetical protein
MQSIIFEDIKCSNSKYSFGRGKYGEFEVIIMKENAFNQLNCYINATKLCADGGKRFDHWLENKSGKDMLNYLSSTTHNLGDEIKILVKDGACTEVRGTYVHNKLIPHIASWVSCEFAFKVSDIVNEWVVREYRLTNIKLSDENTSLLDQIALMRRENKEGIDKVIKLNEEANLKLGESNYMLEETLDELVETNLNNLIFRLHISEERFIKGIKYKV